jgi:hypothetical protein
LACFKCENLYLQISDATLGFEPPHAQAILDPVNVLLSFA